MNDQKILNFIEVVLDHLPADWLNLTTHRLDIYDEKRAKTQFLDQFELLYTSYPEHPSDLASALAALPTSYDYIRLGHPLSCVLEWTIAKLNGLEAAQIISFSSQTAPILAILRKNLLAHQNTKLYYTDELPSFFDVELVRRVYGYQFDLEKVEHLDQVAAQDSELDPSSSVFISQTAYSFDFNLIPSIDFYITIHPQLGSVVLVNAAKQEDYISEIQHVRRRETIAMTPANTLIALKELLGKASAQKNLDKAEAVASSKTSVLASIQEITGSDSPAVVASSGLSMQYAIVMGLIHEGLDRHPGKAIKLVIPPNCYGGTNDQARRVAACLEQVEVVDLLVDGGNDMVQSLDKVLDRIAGEDAIAYIIVEIPTNPRVEVPDLDELRKVLTVARKTTTGKLAVDPVFILDQTFCPNFNFLGESAILAPVQTIAYVSGSKFPSGGKCTAGFAVSNKKAEALMSKIDLHLRLCDNEATPRQLEILAKQLPSMNQRIQDAYVNTREFVSFIQQTLPEAKINFVSEELAAQGFTPSVFSLDLPTKGSSAEERESYKRALNLQLIDLMITRIPNESKYCVSYGQLKGCYWTIPATSTQGTTKEADKDYILRVALSPDMDLELHKEVFMDFVKSI